MILKKDEWRIPLPEPVTPESARLSFWSSGGPRRDPSARLVNVMRVAPEHLLKREEHPLGYPCLFAVTETELLVYPTPACDLEAVFSFFPPRKEI